MNRLVENTVSVLAVTALTALAVYAGVGSLGLESGSAEIAKSGSLAAQTCPATGCSAVSCHATGGVDTATSTTTGDVSAVQTCPATGCSSASCHATEGGGGRGAGHGRRSGQSVTGLDT